MSETLTQMGVKLMPWSTALVYCLGLLDRFLDFPIPSASTLRPKRLASACNPILTSLNSAQAH